MELKKWNVWNTYAYYFIEPIEDLYDVAQKIVQSKLAISAFHSTGIAWYWSEGNVIKSPVEIDHVGYACDTRIKLPNAENSYALECILQSSRMRVFEMGLLNETLQDSLPYVRAHLGECIIELTDQQILLYPQIKIYDNGVFLVEFRTIGPEKRYSLNTLIDKNINLFTHIAENIELPPQIVNLYSKFALYENYQSPIAWYKDIKKLKKYKEKIEQEKYIVQVRNGFEFEYVSLGYGFTIKDIFDYICGALTVSLNNSYNYQIPIKKKKYNLGSYWSGRPSVYLVEFDGQPFNALEIHTKFKTSLNKIMGRTTSEGITTDFLGKNFRAFDDFALYVGRALTLFVFSRETECPLRIHKLSASFHRPFRDPNMDEVYCHHQIKVELTDFVYVSYQRMMERSTLNVKNVTDILHEKEQLLALEKNLQECSHSGELNDFFLHTWEVFGLNSIRANIEQNFALKIARLSELRGLSIQRFGWILSIIFGLSGAVALAQNFIQPLWRQLAIPLPSGEDLLKIYSTIIAAGGMLVIIMIVWLVTVGRKHKA
ncbi:MAG: hypothetical protein ABFD50_04045 [Smithella sp.]